MGLVSKQAYYNSINIVFGFAAGAINTIFVLPQAFEQQPDEWGLVRSVLAYSIVFTQIFGFGTYNIIIKEYNNSNNKQQNSSLLGFSLLLNLVGLGLLFLILLSSEKLLLSIMDKESIHSLYQHLPTIFILTGVLIFSQTFSGYIIAKHKTPIVQFTNDLFLKTAYLGLAISYLLLDYSFDLYLSLFTGIYVISLAIFIFYSLGIGFRVSFSFSSLKLKETIEYGLYTVLNRGAGIIVGNLDLIMIGLLLQLDDVAFYVLAFYIGTVISIPMKAILAPTQPLVSTFLRENKKEELEKIYKQTSINQLIIGAILFLLVWTNIDAINLLLPEKFRGGTWVVFFIAMSKIFIMSTGISGGIIVFSKYYRINLLFNVLLIFITILSNYIFIPMYGITGAALATAITYFLYNAMKVIYIKKTFGIGPWNTEAYKASLIISLLFLVGSFVHITEDMPLLSILLKSSLFLAISWFLLHIFKVKAEILEQPKKIWKRLVP